jgi:hypothetical protein
MKRRFFVTVTTSATIEIDDAVFKEVLNHEWQRTFYNLKTREEVAAHVGYNLMINRIGLSIMDGFGLLADDLASIAPGTLEHETEAMKVKRR